MASINSVAKNHQHHSSAFRRWPKITTFCFHMHTINCILFLKCVLKIWIPGLLSSSIFLIRLWFVTVICCSSALSFSTTSCCCVYLCLTSAWTFNPFKHHMMRTSTNGHVSHSITAPLPPLCERGGGRPQASVLFKELGCTLTAGGKASQRSRGATVGREI